MRKNPFAISAVLLLTMMSSAGCSSNDSNHVIIRVLNSADYIYEAEKEGYYCDECGEYIPDNQVIQSEEDEEILLCPNCNGEVYYDMDMMKQFVAYMDEKYAEEGIKFDYIYDTFDTPETCYNELMTGKSNYDIINVSDYMVQKMMTHNLVRPLFDDSERSQKIKENITDYMSRYLWGQDYSIFNNIYAKKADYNDDEDPYDTSKLLADYSVPYMWGTIGVMYNSSFYEGTQEEVDKEFSSWEVLYGDYASKSFSIKDSVRDVYAVSILHANKDKIEQFEKDYHIGEENEDLDGFNKELTKLFNSCDAETIAKVKEDMLKLKDNAFGFEVDSGKTDMVSGEKIGANLAWSGDATWAIYEAETETGCSISFSIPEEGSNIWFDAWCIPTVAQHPEYALDFIEFMSEPEQAISNMDYVGYTTSTAGDEVLDYMYDLYDVRAVEEDYPDEAFEEYNLSYFFDDSLVEHADEDAILHAWTVDTEATYEEAIDGETVEISYGLSARMLKAQFPEQSMLYRLCVMDDYGKQNEAVLDMWQSVRTNPLPVWAVVLLIVEAILALLVVVYFVTIKAFRKKFHKSHLAQRQ